MAYRKKDPFIFLSLILSELLKCFYIYFQRFSLSAHSIPAGHATVQTAAACVTVLEESLSDFLHHQLCIQHEFRWATYLPLDLPDEQCDVSCYSQQHQFLLFARMSSGMQQSVQDNKTVGRPQSILMPEQAAVLPFFYIVQVYLLKCFLYLEKSSSNLQRPVNSSQTYNSQYYFYFPVFLGP